MVLRPGIIGCKLVMIVCHRYFGKASDDGLGVLAVVSEVALPLMRLSRGRQQKYEMNEEYVRFVGYGRSDSYFHYKGIRRVRVNRARNLIHIRGIAVSAPFFVPPEGFEFVRNYIVSRLPDSAKVSYEE